MGVGAALALVCLVLAVLAIMLVNRKPIVVLITESDRLYLMGKPAMANLTEGNIRSFTEQFVKSYYEWNALEPEKIAQGVTPWVTDGFRAKALSLLKDRKEKEFAGKAIRQNVSSLSVEVTKDSTIALFDVVLRVDGIPLIVPTQVSLQLVKGSPTEWNPMGLYINGATVHEGK